MSWQALKFALDCEKCKSVCEKIVLIEYANHADDRTGYSWPSLKFIASIWHSHPTRLRRARESIIAKKLLFRTKKRSGPTHQNKVFRMPKCTYERGSQSTPLKKTKGDTKGVRKGDERGSQSPTNPDTDNPKPISTDNTLRVVSTTGVQPNAEVSGFLVEKRYQYQKPNRIARDHVKWPEFAGWCRSKRDKRGLPGAPTEEGFWKWLSGQKPQWRNKVRAGIEEDGYELHGKFYPKQEAIRIGAADPNLVLKFREATRRNGRVVLKPLTAK